MRYLGGKSKIAKKLTMTILAATTQRGRLIEPFMGGGAMAASLAPSFESVDAFDINDDLILMWEALKNGWKPPTNISEEQYKELKNAKPSALRAFAGFGGASWGGKWFGGYARGDGRNYADESARSLLRDIQKMQNCTFKCLDYQKIQPLLGDVVYADPPYAGTTEYRDTFDSAQFWETMKMWSMYGADVFVSEYKAPPNWKTLWQVERTRDMKSKFTNAEKVTEKLFTYGSIS
jgi:DNA adenine methylase